MKLHQIFIPIVAALIIFLQSCEKEIDIDVPPAPKQWVVEASINQFSPFLNYVFISNSIDYFKPDLTIGGVGGAQVFITEGRIVGSDTIFDGPLTQFFSISNFEGLDTIFDNFEVVQNLRGIYINPAFVGEAGKAYKLNITLQNGDEITGTTHIPNPVTIDSINYTIGTAVDTAGRKEAFLSFFWNDPPGQNNYRLYVNRSFTGILLGWGASDFSRTFDDQLLDNTPRAYSIFRPFRQTDTVHIYLTTIGRREFLFWESFGNAVNNGGPFATPVQLRSNINGAIGTFTGYGVAYKSAILE
jgi:hypothetical protein